MTQVSFRVGATECVFAIDQLIIAGWTGRERVTVEHHIEELAAIGVKRPCTTPCFYRLGTSLLTTARKIDVVGVASSGEVEFVLLSTKNGIYVGVGSDHTDRRVEAYSVTVSKQMCPKPIGEELWGLTDVESHWDRLILRSHVVRKGKRYLYQEGPVSKMLSPQNLIEHFPDSPGSLRAGTVMYCGTLAVQGEIGGGERFEIELHDPVRNQRLQHEYATRRLDIED